MPRSEPEENYHRQVLEIAGSFQEDCGRLNFEAALSRFRLHNLAEQSARRGWRGSIYDMGVCYMGHQVAERCAQLRQFDAAYKIVKELSSLLSAGDRRRGANSEQTLFNTETRLDLLRVTADCLAHDPRGELSSHTNAPDCVKVYRRLLPRWLDGIKKLADTRELMKSQRMLDRAAWTCLAVIKSATRYGCAEYLALVQEFNREFGATLMAQAGHFIKSSQPSGRAVFYWDYEFYKLTQGVCGIRDLRHCHDLRMAALAADSGCEIDAGLEYGWQLDYAVAAADARRRGVEVAGG